MSHTLKPRRQEEKGDVMRVGRGAGKASFSEPHAREPDELADGDSSSCVLEQYGSDSCDSLAGLALHRNFIFCFRFMHFTPTFLTTCQRYNTSLVFLVFFPLHCHYSASLRSSYLGSGKH